MNVRVFTVAALVSAGICSILGSVPFASAHGVPMYVQADESGALSSTELVFYDAGQSKLSLFPVAAPAIVRGTVAFHPVHGDGIPTGAILNADAAGSAIHPTSLLYWNGGAVLPSPVAINFTRAGVDFNVSPTDAFVAGGALGAYDGTPSGHSSFTAALPLDAPAGLYAIGFQVEGGEGFEGLTRSNTFWGVLNYGVPVENVPAGLAAITSAVPEPSSLLLLAVGVAFYGVATFGRRGRHRS